MHIYLAPGLEPGPPLDRTNPLDRYLAIVRWAAWRYSDRYGTLVVVERNEPTTYTRIERAAWSKYVA